MIVKKYYSELISINNPCKGLFTLEFTSLSGKYKYHPGQFLHIALDSAYDGSGQWPDSRCFSMQSNPDEETIRLTYTVKGIFTRQIEKQLIVGSKVWLKLPFGDLFTQNHKKDNSVFIAGGTGITPFLSLFTHKSFQEYENPHVYLGFRSKELNIYSEIIKDFFNTSIFLKIYYQNIDGIINIQQIVSDNGINKSYFISGPPDMIKEFRHTLIFNGVSEKNILTDDWG